MASIDTYTCRTISDLASIVGNMQYRVINYIQSVFPKGFIKHIHTSTSKLSLDMDGNDDIHSIKKPALRITPTVSLDPGETSLEYIPSWSNVNFLARRDPGTQYSPVFNDSENKISMYTVMDRVKVSFEIEILCDTYMQQINIANFLKGSFRHKQPYFIRNNFIESEIPNYYMVILRKEWELKYKDDLLIEFDSDEANAGLSANDREAKWNETLEEAFSVYLSSNSQRFITEKLKASNDKYHFFYLYQSNVQVEFTDFPQLSGGDENGQSKEGFKVTETFTTEFWFPQHYFLQLLSSTSEPYSYEMIENETNESLELNLTLKFAFGDKYGNLSLIRKAGYTTENAESDVLPLKKFIPLGVRKVITYCLEHGIDCNTLFHFEIFEDFSRVGDELKSINWETLDFTQLKTQVNKGYTIAFYGDQYMINKITHKLQELEGYNYHK